MFTVGYVSIEKVNGILATILLFLFIYYMFYNILLLFIAI